MNETDGTEEELSKTGKSLNKFKGQVKEHCRIR